jgi:hypothetical protein
MANLATQMAGSRFTYERHNTPPTTFTQLTLSTQAHIKQPHLEYEDVGLSGILVKQTAEVMVRQAEIDQAFTCSMDLRVENVATAEAVLIRRAVEKAVESRMPNLSKISGTVYLTDVSMSPHRREPGVNMSATLLVVFDPPPS